MPAVRQPPPSPPCSRSRPLSSLQQSERVGTVDFPTSASSPEAQSHFLRGVAALHSFGWKQAIAEFEAAQTIEPDFAMPYWGQSLCYNHPLFSELDPAEPRQALAKLGGDPAARSAKAPTEREKGFLAAVEALWGEGDQQRPQDRLRGGDGPTPPAAFPRTTRSRRSTRWRCSRRPKRWATTICATTSAPARSRSTSSLAAPTIPAPPTT